MFVAFLFFRKSPLSSNKFRMILLSDLFWPRWTDSFRIVWNFTNNSVISFCIPAWWCSIITSFWIVAFSAWWISISGKLSFKYNRSWLCKKIPARTILGFRPSENMLTICGKVSRRSVITPSPLSLLKDSLLALWSQRWPLDQVLSIPPFQLRVPLLFLWQASY